MSFYDHSYHNRGAAIDSDDSDCVEIDEPHGGPRRHLTSAPQRSYIYSASPNELDDSMFGHETEHSIPPEYEHLLLPTTKSETPPLAAKENQSSVEGEARRPSMEHFIADDAFDLPMVPALRRVSQAVSSQQGRGSIIPPPVLSSSSPRARGRRFIPGRQPIVAARNKNASPHVSGEESSGAGSYHNTNRLSIMPSVTDSLSSPSTAFASPTHHRRSQVHGSPPTVSNHLQRLRSMTSSIMGSMFWQNTGEESSGGGAGNPFAESCAHPPSREHKESTSFEVVGERIPTGNRSPTMSRTGSRLGVSNRPTSNSGQYRENEQGGRWTPSRPFSPPSPQDLSRLRMTSTTAVLQARPPSKKGQFYHSVIPSSPQPPSGRRRIHDVLDPPPLPGKRHKIVPKKTINALVRSAKRGTPQAKDQGVGEHGSVIMKRTFMGVTKVLYEDGKVEEIRWDQMDPKVAGLAFKDGSLSRDATLLSQDESPTPGNLVFEEGAFHVSDAAPVSDSPFPASTSIAHNHTPSRSPTQSASPEPSPKRLDDSAVTRAPPVAVVISPSPAEATVPPVSPPPQLSGELEVESVSTPPPPLLPLTPTALHFDKEEDDNKAQHAEEPHPVDPIFLSPLTQEPFLTLQHAVTAALSTTAENLPESVGIRRISPPRSPMQTQSLTSGPTAMVWSPAGEEGVGETRVGPGSSGGRGGSESRRKSTTFVLDDDTPVSERNQKSRTTLHLLPGKLVFTEKNESDISKTVEGSAFLTDGGLDSCESAVLPSINVATSWEEELEELRQTTIEDADSLLTIPLPELSQEGEMRMEDIHLCGIPIYDLFHRLFEREKGAMRSQLSGLDVNRFMRHSLSANEMVVMYFWFVVVHCRRVYMERLLIMRFARLTFLYQELFPRGNKVPIPDLFVLRQLIVELRHASKRWTRKTNRKNGGKNTSVVREEEITQQHVQELHAHLLKGNYTTILSMPDLRRGGTLPDDESINLVSHGLNLLACAMMEHEELVRYEELCFHRLAILFGAIFTEVQTDERDVILQSYGFIVVRIANYALNYSFPNDANAGLFHADFRADLYRVFQFWCSGLQVTHVAVKGWPLPRLRDFEVEKEREELRLQELVETYEQGYQKAMMMAQEAVHAANGVNIGSFRFGDETEDEDEDDKNNQLSDREEEGDRPMSYFMSTRGSVDNNSVCEGANGGLGASVASMSVHSTAGMSTSKANPVSQLISRIRKGSISQMMGVDDIREEMQTSFRALPKGAENSTRRISSQRRGSQAAEANGGARRRRSGTVSTENNNSGNINKSDEENAVNTDDSGEVWRPPTGRRETQVGSATVHGGGGGGHWSEPMQVGTRSKIFTGDLDDDDDEKAERIITKKRNSSFFRRRTTVGAQKKANEAGGLFAQQNKMRAKPLQDSTFEDIEVECANAEYRLLNLYHKYTKHAQMLQQEGEKRVQRIYKRMKREEREQYCKQQLAQLRAAKAAAAAASATSPGRRRPLGIGDSTVLSHESTVVTNTDSGTPQPVPFSPRKDIGFTGSLTLGRRPNHTAGSLSGDGGGGTPAISPTSDGASRLLAEKPPHSSSLLPSLLPDGATKPQLPYIHVLDDDEGPLQNTNTSMTLPGAGGNATKNQKSFFSTFTTNSSGGGADIPSFWYGDSTAPEPEDAIGPVGAVQLIEVSPDSLPVNVDVAVKSTALNSLSVGITDAYPSATTGTRTGVSRTVFPHSSISPMARSSGGKGAPVSTTQRTVSSSLTPPIPQQTSFFSGTTPRPETTSPRGTSPALAMHATSPVMNLSTFQKEHRSSTPPPQGPATVLPTTTQKRSSLKGASLTRLFLARVHRQLQNREVEKMREKFKTTENPKTAPSLTAMAKEAARKVRQQPVDATFQNAEPLPVSRLLQGGPQDASLISSQPLAQLHDEEARHFFTHINPVRPARIPLPEASVNAVSRSDTGKHIPGSSLTEEGLLFPGEKPAADNSNQKEYELKRLYKRQLLPSSSPFMTYYSAAVLNLEVVQPPVGTTLAGQTSTLLNNSSDMNSLNFKDTIVHGGTVSSPPASPQSNPLHQRMHGTATCLSGGRKSRESTPRQASSTPSSPNNTKRRPSQTGPRPAPKPKFKGVGRAVVSKTHLLVVPREEGLHRPVLYKPLCHAASQQLRTVLQDMKKIRKREYLSRQQYSGDHISALSRIHRLESEVAERRFQQQARENLELVLHHKANSSTGTHPHPANSQGAPTVDTARSVSRDSSPTTQRMSVGSTGYSLSKTVVDAVGPRKNTIPMDSFLPRFGTQTVGQGEARGGEKKNGGNGGLSPVTPRPSRVSGPSFLPTIM